MTKNPLKELEALGQSIWLDYISRDLITSGGLQQLVSEDGLSGATSNPTIFKQAIMGTKDYEWPIRALAEQGRTREEIYQSITIEDIRAAADVFRPVYDRTGGEDGFMSLEVSPRLAHSTQATVAEARQLWALVDRPNVMIKVPATAEGIPAIGYLIGEGINVNITLLFGLPRYREVIDAYLNGLETMAADGRKLDRIASVASFFLSRIDVLIDPLLEQKLKGNGRDGKLATNARGQVAIASAKMAYEIYTEVFTGAHFQRLAEKGARTQRLLWASTGTKNKEYSDVKYVEPLIGPDTINTLPQETIIAYRDHGKPKRTLDQNVDEARKVLQSLPILGIDLAEMTQKLEDEGVEKFNKSYDELLNALPQQVGEKR